VGWPRLAGSGAAAARGPLQTLPIRRKTHGTAIAAIRSILMSGRTRAPQRWSSRNRAIGRVAVRAKRRRHKKCARSCSPAPLLSAPPPLLWPSISHTHRTRYRTLPLPRHPGRKIESQGSNQFVVHVVRRTPRAMLAIGKMGNVLPVARDRGRPGSKTLRDRRFALEFDPAFLCDRRPGSPLTTWWPITAPPHSPCRAPGRRLFNSCPQMRKTDRP
jgi:hypothetical protein